MRLLLASLRRNTLKNKPTTKMKLNKLTTVATAMATAAVLATSGRAQVYTPDPVPSGDVLIGFEQQGNASDYVVDLGQVTQFKPTTSDYQIQLSTADLGGIDGVFGTNWASNSNGSTDVQWGVVANDQSDTIASDPDGNSIWYTKGETTVGTHTTAPIRGSSSALGAISQNIENFETLGYAGQAATAGTENSSDLGVILTASAADSWTSFKPGSYSGNTAFGIGSEIEQPSSGSYTGPTDSVLDFYEVDTKTASNQSATLLGTFSLSSGGVLTFEGADAAVVPEPSTYALVLAGGSMLLLVLKRRKSRLAVA